VRPGIVSFKLGPVGGGADEARHDRVDALGRGQIVADGRIAVDPGRVEGQSTTTPVRSLPAAQWTSTAPAVFATSAIAPTIESGRAVM
jgi:hypothetical protein